MGCYALPIPSTFWASGMISNLLRRVLLPHIVSLAVHAHDPVCLISSCHGGGLYLRSMILWPHSARNHRQTRCVGKCNNTAWDCRCLAVLDQYDVGIAGKHPRRPELSSARTVYRMFLTFVQFENRLGLHSHTA